MKVIKLIVISLQVRCNANISYEYRLNCPKRTPVGPKAKAYKLFEPRRIQVSAKKILKNSTQNCCNSIMDCVLFYRLVIMMQALYIMIFGFVFVVAFCIPFIHYYHSKIE